MTFDEKFEEHPVAFVATALFLGMAAGAIHNHLRKKKLRWKKTVERTIYEIEDYLGEQ